jgi:hypothetical protein
MKSWKNSNLQRKKELQKEFDEYGSPNRKKKIDNKPIGYRSNKQVHNMLLMDGMQSGV